MRSKTRTILRRLTGVVGSNQTRDRYVCVYSVFVMSLRQVWSPVQGVLPIVNKIMKLKWNEAFHRCLRSRGSNRKYEYKWTLYIINIRTYSRSTICIAVQSGSSPTFRRNIFPPFWGSKNKPVLLPASDWLSFGTPPKRRQNSTAFTRR
jgi:hypothetical protein